MNKFSLEHFTLKVLLINNTRYSIPEYQRPYSWDCAGKSELNNQLNRMWDDLIEFFNSTKDGVGGEYFLGSMVMIAKKDAIAQKDAYEVIDGQQRLTSLILLYVAIKCFLTKIDNKEIKCIGIEEDVMILQTAVKDAIRTVNDVLYNKEVFGFKTEKKVKIEKSAEFNYDEVLEKVMECKEKNIWEHATPEQQINIDRYYKNRDFFLNCIEQTFSKKGELSTENYIQLAQFIEFLQERVTVVKITTSDFNAAYQIFEILNNRGLPLSNKDLFRNFVISEFAAIKDKTPSGKWIELEQQYALTPDFLSRWVESVKGGQQKFSAFNDLNDIYDKRYNDVGQPKIIKLYNDIQQDLSYYTWISRDTNLVVDKILRNKILFLKNAGNQGYTYNLLIALLRHFKFKNTTENEQIITFLTQYEKFVLYGILAPNRRFSSSAIYQAINYLNDNKYDKAFNEFLLEDEELSELKDLLNQNVVDNKTAALLVAKCHWVAETKKTDVGDFILDFKAATLEHIIPQNPENATNWLRDFKPEFRKNNTYKIGNMTLLTQSMNSSVKNYDFEVKKEGVKKKSKGYKDTNFPFTIELCKYIKIQPQDIIDRQTRFLNLLYEDLNL